MQLDKNKLHYAERDGCEIKHAAALLKRPSALLQMQSPLTNNKELSRRGAKNTSLCISHMTARSIN